MHSIHLFEPYQAVMVDAAGNKILLCSSVPTRKDSIVRLNQAVESPFDMFAVIWKHDDINRSNQVLFWNPDGSSETFCGNACRSIGALASGQVELSVPSGTVSAGGDERSGWFELRRATPIVVGNCDGHPIYLVNPGTPHIVFFEPMAEEGYALLDQLSVAYNASVTRIIEFQSHTLVVDTNERGVGFTESCGSGALSACLAVNKENYRHSSLASYQVQFTSGQKLQVDLNSSRARVSGLVVCGNTILLNEGEFQPIGLLQDKTVTNHIGSQALALAPAM